MRIQNYQTNYNNQPKFKQNVLVQNRVAKAIVGRCTDVVEEVLQIALDSGHVVRPRFSELPVFKVAKGYLVPDIREPKGEALFNSYRSFYDERSLEPKDFIARQDAMEALAAEISEKSDTVVLKKIPEFTTKERTEMQTENFLREVQSFGLDGLD